MAVDTLDLARPRSSTISLAVLQSGLLWRKSRISISSWFSPYSPGQGLKTGGVIPFESVHKTYLLLHSPTSFML